MSGPRSPDDGPSWPERDLDENRAEEPGAGWSDDPYRYQPLPPNKPSDEPLEGEWSDSEPFDPEPLEADPFAPAAVPPQDDTWGFPPRAEPTYEPAPSEPELVAQPEWDTPALAEPEPIAAEEPAPDEAEEPSATEPIAADEPAPEEAEQPEPEPEAPEESAEVGPSFGYVAEPDDATTAAETDLEPEPAAEADSEPEPMADAEPVAASEAEPTADDAEPELEMVPPPAEEPPFEPDRTEEIAAAAIAAEAAMDEPPWEPEPIEDFQPEADAGAEPFPEPAFEPEHDAAAAVALEAAAATTAFGGAEAWDPKVDGNRRRPTTAEQAVPWLIGIILALAGMVIVLLALIFSSPNGLVASDATATPNPSGSVLPSGSAAVDPSTEPTGSGDASPSASAQATPEPTPNEPNFGPLEMTYLGRPQTTAPIYMMLRDFSVAQDPDVVARADEGVSSYANAPNGRVSVAVIGGRAVAIDRGGKTRRLAENIRTVTFGWDAETVYAARIVRDGNDDLARILEIDFVSGATKNLATIRYRHPDTGAEAPLKEAQFIDDGGLVRLYAVADGNLTLWVLGAPATYRIDPANGDVTDVGREPILWSPDGTLRVTTHEDGNHTALRLRDRGSNVIAAIGVDGLVSHIRWAGGSNEIVFTLGVESANGGVRQDLWVWDLEDRKDPMPLTSSGAAFGAEWRGVMSNWGP